jgi:hypothetical protein
MNPKLILGIAAVLIEASITILRLVKKRRSKKEWRMFHKSHRSIPQR